MSLLSKVSEKTTSKDSFSPKQLEFIRKAYKKYNLAHGSMRSGKTVCSLLAFLKSAFECPGDMIVICGYSLNSIYSNIISLLLHNSPLSFLRPFCSWSSTGRLMFANKTILCKGCGDEGTLGVLQGMTIDLIYCDEMALYPLTVIDTIQTRLSMEHSRLYAAMNPKGPSHKLKQWIDRSETDPDYFSMHFTLDDNPFVNQSYKDDLRKSLSGVFYKRNYLGLWCLAEGAIYDFFDKNIHVCSRPPKAAEYWIAGIDYGVRNPFCCLIIGVNTGRFDQQGKRWWVEKEYYWDSLKKERQKTNSEYTSDMARFMQDYSIKTVYIDPSASGFKLDLSRAGFHVVNANNEVLEGIQKVTDEMNKGSLTICSECVNLIREIEDYVWNDKAAQKGEDEPLKGNGVADHAVDALRYAIATHKVSSFDEDAYYKKQQESLRNRYF